MNGKSEKETTVASIVFIFICCLLMVVLPRAGKVKRFEIGGSFKRCVR